MGQNSFPVSQVVGSNKGAGYIFQEIVIAKRFNQKMYPAPFISFYFLCDSHLATRIN